MARKPLVLLMHKISPTEQFLFVPSRIYLFTVNTCHIATEILLNNNNNTYSVKLLALEAFNEKKTNKKPHMFLIKKNK